MKERSPLQYQRSPPKGSSRSRGRSPWTCPTDSARRPGGGSWQPSGRPPSGRTRPRSARTASRSTSPRPRRGSRRPAPRVSLPPSGQTPVQMLTARSPPCRRSPNTPRRRGPRAVDTRGGCRLAVCRAHGRDKTFSTGWPDGHSALRDKWGARLRTLFSEDNKKHLLRWNPA